MFNITDPKPNIFIFTYDQAADDFVFENETIKKYREKYCPNATKLKNLSVKWANHQVNATACVPSRTSLFTGKHNIKNSISTIKKDIKDNIQTNVLNTDGVAKTAEEITWLNPQITPTLGNILINSGKYNLEDVIYCGKHHLKNTNLTDNYGRQLQTLDDVGNIIEKNLKIYRDLNLLSDLGFTWLNGPDPHGGILKQNSGYLVDSSNVSIAIKHLEERLSDPIKSNKPIVFVQSFLQPHDMVYFPTIWFKLWNLGIPAHLKIPLEDIPLSATDNMNIDSLPRIYQNWVRRYDKYFTQQDPRTYRQFYYYLLAIADVNLGIMLDYIENSPYGKSSIILFTSDHGDLFGTHGGGYQKWYAPFEPITHIFCYWSYLSNNQYQEPNGSKNMTTLTSHIDILPTICSILNINYDGFDGINRNYSTEDYNKVIMCNMLDHITQGSNTIRFPGRIFPALTQEFDMSFIPVDSENCSDQRGIYPEYAIKIIWKYIDNKIYKLAIYYDPKNIFDPTCEIMLKDFIKRELVLLYCLTTDPEESINLIKEDENYAIALDLFREIY